MTVRELKAYLAQAGELPVRFILPGETPVPAHAHVTEVARVDKRFVDCGGTLREDAFCRLQTWVAEDLDHRLNARKLLGILDKGDAVLRSVELTVDVEHETTLISQYPLREVRLTDGELQLHLDPRHTDCLARELCLPAPQAQPVSFKPRQASP